MNLNFTYLIWRFLLLFPFYPLTAQTGQQIKDSLRNELRKDSAHIYRVTIAKPYLKVENRNSFLVKEKINLLGFLAGVTLYERHIVSAGYYFLGKKSREFITLPDNTGEQRFSKLSYFDFAYQYVLLNYRYLQLNVPFEIGYGSYDATITDNNGGIRAISGNILPLGYGLQLFLKPLRWIGISGSGGYREVKHDAIKLQFNGWYYSFGIWIDARLLIRNLKYAHRRKMYRRELKKY